MTKQKNKHGLRCAIIGDGTLPLRCAEILLGNGHELCGFVSADAKNKKWGGEHGIQTYLTPNDLLTGLPQPIDYLFSIVNGQILPPEIINLPLKAAINYHDGPLPRYAGTHATSWALINQERSHGITWHLITDVVDAGDTLKQKKVDIDENETAHSLNTKCYEAATQAFNELIDELAKDSGKREPQNLTERTFFPRFKRPANGGVIRWDSPASEISALIRALDFGPHPNPLGTPKILIDGTFLIVSEVESTGLRSRALPGTVSEIGPDYLRISTADQELVLRSFTFLDGTPLTVTDLATEFDVCEGCILPTLGDDEYGWIENRVKETTRYESYWVRKLSQLDPATPPFARSGSAGSSPLVQQIEVTVPDQFRDLAERSGSFESYIAAAFGGFIARFVENGEFGVGYSDPSIREAAAESRGLLADQVPVRFAVDLQTPFGVLLGTFQEQQDAVKKNRSFSRDIYKRYPALAMVNEATRSGHYPFNILVVDGETNSPAECKGDITLIVDPEASDCQLSFDTTQVAATEIKQFLSCFTNFLDGIGTDPELDIAQHSLLDEKDRDLLLYGLNRRTVELPNDECIHHLFESQVLQTPDSVALIVGEKEYTYRQLNDRAEHIAYHLVSSGVGPEVLVAICMQRSFDMVASIFGTLKAGGAYVPLDPAYPKARLEQILTDSGASILLSESSVREKLGRTEAQIVLIDENLKPFDQATPIPTTSPVKPNNLAYVIYTSGSTGRPKGVAIEHRNTVAFLKWATSVFSVDQLSGTVASTSVCFDLSVFEMFAPLSCGGTAILVENILHLPTSPAAGRATLINTVPSAIAELLKVSGIPDSVTTVNLAGEPLKTSLVKRIYESGNVQAVNDLYGPTEDTTYSTYTLRNDGPATIGRPIHNTQAYILDKNLEPVPPGFPGELHLAGDGLARGYLNRPDLTEARFVPNPFANDRDARMYKTGDLVRYLPSFEIEYLGRIDNQVKIRGFRIELGEIETVLSSHPAIDEVAVVAATDDTRGARLVAYFVPCGPNINPAAELREFLKEKLPDYMLPSAFVQLNEMPLTPNGKLDRKRLPAPSTSLSAENSNYVAPRNEVEARLVRVWERLLKVSPIGVRDDFFDLGGDSLVSVSLFVEIENEFGVELPLSVLIGASTIEKLATALVNAGEAQWRYLVPLRSEGDKPAIFCMHAAGGNVLFYRDLASELGEGQPFYGLQARGVADKSETAHDNIEEMARDYLSEIRSLQPHGPYHLCGASFGGLVAFEAARQLMAAGERVVTISVFDTYAPGYVVPNDDVDRGGRLSSLIFRARGIQNQLAAMNSWKHRAAFVGSKAAKVHKQIKRKIAWTKNQFAIEYNKATGRELPQNMMRNHAAIRKAMDSYMPGKFDGDLLLFRASEQPSQKVDPQLGWREFVSGEITVVDVKGQHGALTVYPFASDLAEKYRPFLSVAPAVRANVKEVESAAVAVA